MLFRGKILRNLDAKGRLMVPVEFREILFSRSEGGRFILTCYDGCLVGFPMPEWEEFESKLMMIKNPSRMLRDFRRFIVGSAEDLSLDKQGRVLLSQDHRAYAGLDKDVLLVGQLQKFEIWNPTMYRDSIAVQNYDAVAQEAQDSGVELPF